MCSDTELAWLAGLLDGEGSVGLSISKQSQSRTGGVTLVAAVQLSMTCPATVARVAELFVKLGVGYTGYTYQERDPAKHRDAHLLHVKRLLDVQLLAQKMVPFSVTKRCHWQLMVEYTARRLRGYKFDSQGRVVRGGHGRRPYDTEDFSFAERFRLLNARGAASSQIAYRRRALGRPQAAEAKFV